jgi:peptidoglycan/LPS O-acetylase OafA/YrhL
MSSSATSPSSQASSLSSALSLDLLDNRYPSLHGLRVIAIISVVQYHVTWIFAGEQNIRIEHDFMWSSLSVFFGMDLFFILSGFLIGSILLRSIETDGTQNLRRFYLRRISRTFPAYYVVLTFLALTTALTDLQKAHLPWEYVYGTNFMPLNRPQIVMFWGWSLALEEQFYLTVPLLFFVLTRLKKDEHRVALLVVLWAGALAARIGIYLHGRPWLDGILYDRLYFRPLTRYDTLICGIILAFVHRRWGKDVERWLVPPSRRAFIALLSLACLWILLEPDMFGARNVQLVHVFAWGSITSVMYFGWLILLLHGDREGWLTAALSLPIFRKIATLGYGVYLVHIPLIDQVIVPAAKSLEAKQVPMTVIWPLSLTVLMLASLGLAYVMHVLIEKPSLRVRERIAG